MYKDSNLYLFCPWKYEKNTPKKLKYLKSPFILRTDFSKTAENFSTALSDQSAQKRKKVQNLFEFF